MRVSIVRMFSVSYLFILIQAFALMVDNRTFGAVKAPLSRGAIGIAQVIVLPAVLVSVVKRTDGEEFAATDQDAGSGEHLVFAAFVDERRIAGRTVVDMVRLGQRTVGVLPYLAAMLDCPVREYKLWADNADVRVLFKTAVKGREPIRLYLGIIVEENKVFAPCFLGAAVAGTCKTKVGIIPKGPDL